MTKRQILNYTKQNFTQSSLRIGNVKTFHTGSNSL